MSVNYSEINRIRKRYIEKFFGYLLVFILLETGLFFLLRGSEYFLIIFPVGFLGLFFLTSVPDAYKNFLKENIYKPFLEELGIEYKPERGFDEEIVKNCVLLPGYDDYESKNYIKGGNFEAAEIKLSEEYYDSDEKRYESRTVFEGVLLIVYSKKTLTPLLITKNSFHLSDILPIFTDKYRQKMDDLEFEKMFDVYAADPIEARKILTHNVMRELIKLKKETDFYEMFFEGTLRFVTFKDLKLVDISSMFTEMNEERFLLNIFGVIKIFKVVEFLNEKAEA